MDAIDALICLGFKIIECKNECFGRFKLQEPKGETELTDNDLIRGLLREVFGNKGYYSEVLNNRGIDLGT